MQLADLLIVHCNFDVQRATDWMIVFRREKAAPDHRRPKHLGYYEITVGKALALKERLRAEEERRRTSEGKKAEAAAHSAKNDKLVSRVADGEARGVLWDVLKREITRMIVLTDNGEKTYQIEVDGTIVTIGGVAAIFNSDIATRQVWDATGRAFPALKKKRDWVDVILPALHAIKQEVALDADHGRVRRWIRAWFEAAWGGECEVCTSEDDSIRALRNMAGAPLEKGHGRVVGIVQTYGDSPVCIFRAQKLTKWLQQYGGESAKALEGIRQRLVAAGFHRNAESETIEAAGVKITLRDVYVGGATWWGDGGQ